jgi:hypothetical protein
MVFPDESFSVVTPLILVLAQRTPEVVQDPRGRADYGWKPEDAGELSAIEVGLELLGSDLVRRAVKTRHAVCPKL